MEVSGPTADAIGPLVSVGQGGHQIVEVLQRQRLRTVAEGRLRIGVDFDHETVGPDGSTGETALKTSEMKVGEVAVLLAEVAGTYSAGMSMGMAPSEPQPGYKLLGAVAEGADANWFFKFTGPEKTVDANRTAFEGMLKSLRRGE